jgi:hypothetical protein
LPLANSMKMRVALGELDRELEQVREIMKQIAADAEAADYSGPFWESPTDALPFYLNRLHDILAVFLEVAGLPDTRTLLIEKWPSPEYYISDGQIRLNGPSRKEEKLSWSARHVCLSTLGLAVR